MSRRHLPSVDALAASLAGSGLPRPLLVSVARRAVAAARAEIEGGGDPDVDAIAASATATLVARRDGRIVNATGVLLHTNLGRAVLHRDAAAAATAVATSYSAVELDPATGERGGRGSYLGHLMCAITGAEDALAVGNNAAGLVLALAAVAGGGSVAASRGELIEIGGSFRLPELMTAAGTTLLEVGTTNRTHPADYEAVASRCRALLKIHPSNYRVEGFAAAVDYRTLAGIGAEYGIPLIADVGSGLVDSRAPWLDGPPPPWLAAEPGIVQTLEAGAGLVLFSGDKLLGGPQGGYAVGSHRLVEAMRRHPLARAVRCDGPTLAAAAATLEFYAENRAAELPFWRMATIPMGVLETRATAVATATGGVVEDGMSVPGAGTVPGHGIPTPVVRIPGAADAWSRLLGRTPPILARRDEGDLVVDVRAVAPDDDSHLIAALVDVCR